MTTNGAGRRSHTGLSLPAGAGRPYGHMYLERNFRQTDDDEDKKILAMMFPIFAGIFFIVICLLCLCGRKNQDQDRQQGAGEVGRGAPAAAVDVEMPPVPVANPPLVCTYRKADGWQDATCGVCLAELADGDTLRVLPPCMHYFHDACVGEWLRAHDTCPLCRATLGAPATAASSCLPTNFA